MSALHVGGHTSPGKLSCRTPHLSTGSFRARLCADAKLEVNHVCAIRMSPVNFQCRTRRVRWIHIYYNALTGPARNFTESRQHCTVQLPPAPPSSRAIRDSPRRTPRPRSRSHSPAVPADPVHVAFPFAAVAAPFAPETDTKAARFRRTAWGQTSSIAYWQYCPTLATRGKTPMPWSSQLSL